MSDLNRQRRMIDFAMKRHESVCLAFSYRDRKGDATQRIVSPTHWINGQTFKAFCLTRGDYRNFELSKMTDAKFSLTLDTEIGRTACD